MATEIKRFIPTNLRKRLRTFYRTVRPNSVREQPIKVDVHDPVIIYQMGKVASSSVYKSLKSTGKVNVYHVHSMNPNYIAKHSVNPDYISGLYDDAPNRVIRFEDNGMHRLGLELYEQVFEGKQHPAKIITLVREPIGRNISAYFQNLSIFVDLVGEKILSDMNLLMDTFVLRFNHSVPLKWFDIEIGTVLGINVWDTKFAKDDGYQFIKHSPYELLIMRHDLEDAIKQELIVDLLGLAELSLDRFNVGSAKPYADLYEEFLQEFCVSSDYASQMLESRYAKHFFPHEELGTLRKRWVEGI